MFEHFVKLYPWVMGSTVGTLLVVLMTWSMWP